VNQLELERSILEARDRGDVPTMERLQERYRTEYAVTRISRAPVRLVEHSPQSPPVAPERSAGRSSGPVVSVPTVVRLRSEAHSTILNMPLHSGVECGGLLVGHIDDGEIVIETCYGRKGGDLSGEHDRLALDGGWLGIVDEKARRCGWNVVGDVHSHPRGAPEPSTIEEDGWRGMADDLRQHYVGIVIGRDPNRVGWAHDGLWTRPQFCAFVAIHGDRTVRPINLILEEAF
jgi:Prokaryotic homologs of the JAB domain